MANLKDSLNDKRTVTLNAADLHVLGQLNAYLQQELDLLQNRMAGMLLNYFAVEKFGMDPGKDYQFEYHPDREYDNLTITVKEQ